MSENTHHPAPPAPRTEASYIGVPGPDFVFAPVELEAEIVEDALAVASAKSVQVRQAADADDRINDQLVAQARAREVGRDQPASAAGATAEPHGDARVERKP